MMNDIFDINENIIYDYFNNTRATFLDKDISVFCLNIGLIVRLLHCSFTTNVL